MLGRETFPRTQDACVRPLVLSETKGMLNSFPNMKFVTAPLAFEEFVLKMLMLFLLVLVTSGPSPQADRSLLGKCGGRASSNSSQDAMGR